MNPEPLLPIWELRTAAREPAGPAGAVDKVATGAPRGASGTIRSDTRGRARKAPDGLPAATGEREAAAGGREDFRDPAVNLGTAAWHHGPARAGAIMRGRRERRRFRTLASEGEP